MTERLEGKCDSDEMLIMEQLNPNDWWGGTDFKEMERITGYRQLDFDPEDGYQAFVDACNKWWNEQTPDEKITLWENHG